MPTETIIALIFFFYGLAFFSMGLGVTLEIGHGSDVRLRKALRPLAVFGLVHGIHEWLEMFDILGLLHGEAGGHRVWEALRLALLVWSFLSLATFGAYLLARDEHRRRLSLLLPLALAALWGFGLFIMRSQYPPSLMFDVADVWSRYTLAIPAALVACLGLVFQQREFRKAGLARFGRDSLWAAIAFFWYGFVGQTFTRASPLPPSDVINQGLFLETFGFPVQLLRAGAATVAAIFVIRFLRSFEVETKARIAELQAAQLQEAQRREAMRGEILRRIVAAQESERQRIARELHDETGQALTAIGLGLRGVATTLRQDTDKAARNLRQLESLAARSLNELQRVIADLRPSHLDDLGLSATLRWYAAEVQNHTGLQVEVELVGEKLELPAEVKTTLFRVTQEALTNVVKHSGASWADVRLCYCPEGVRIQVQDNGHGFDPLDLDANKRYGLMGMRERAALVGGSFNLTSVLGSGTQVEVIIPYPEHKERQEYEHSDSSGG